jgi:hypothetical protein
MMNIPLYNMAIICRKVISDAIFSLGFHMWVIQLYDTLSPLRVVYKYMRISDQLRKVGI